MSVANEQGVQLSLPRTGGDALWRLLDEGWAGNDAHTWKLLAMLALRENAGWPLKYISRVFGHANGHTLRCIEQAKAEIRSRFQLEPSMNVAPLTDAVGSTTDDISTT